MSYVLFPSVRRLASDRIEALGESTDDNYAMGEARDLREVVRARCEMGDAEYNELLLLRATVEELFDEYPGRTHPVYDSIMRQTRDIFAGPNPDDQEFLNYVRGVIGMGIDYQLQEHPRKARTNKKSKEKAHEIQAPNNGKRVSSGRITRKTAESNAKHSDTMMRALESAVAEMDLLSLDGENKSA